MKHIYNLLPVLAILLFCGSCSEPEPIVVQSLTLSANSVVFDCKGGEQSVAVSPFPESVEWQITPTAADAEQWYELTKQQNRVVVVAQPNETLSERVSLFYIEVVGESDVEPYAVSVCQEAGRAFDLKTSAPESCLFDSEGDSFTFTVISELQWEATSDSDWLTVERTAERVKVVSAANPDDKSSRTGKVVVATTDGNESFCLTVEQQSRSQNGYLQLLGQWEITATKWFYSPNGSLNELDYNPSQSQYFLIFDLEQGEYGKTFIMNDFLYPSTSLEVKYDKKGGGIVIPFGWSVLSYDVFLYITLINSNKFSFASLEVETIPSADYATMKLNMPKVEGFSYVGFGLWTYDDSGNKVAFGYRSQPTMFPMGDIVFRKYIN